MRVRFTAGVVPDELPAAIICARVLVVPDPIALLSHTNQTRLSGNAGTLRLKQVDDRNRRGITWLRNLLSLVAHPICITPDVMTVTS